MENKGLSGLSNLGNTCFINSCLQILSHTTELNILLNQKSYKHKLQKKCDSALLLEWDNLRKMLWEKNCIVSPNKFLQTVQKVAQVKNWDIFTGYSQNDCAEFLIFLIDCFHNALAREIQMKISGTPENETDKLAIQCFETVKKMYTKEYSEIWKLFYGIHVSQLTTLDKTCEILQQSPEPFFMIDLPIPQDKKGPSLIDCFNLYVEGEVLEGDNAWYCEERKTKMGVRKRIQYWSFPTVLVIDLKRFHSTNKKRQVLVDFPLENLDLSKYVIGYQKNSFVYDLYGVCNHSGSVYGGHYTSFVKNANGKWYHFNDTLISEVSDSKAVITPKAYVLFYRKK